jgi:hypothetical protein
MALLEMAATDFPLGSKISHATVAGRDCLARFAPAFGRDGGGSFRDIAGKLAVNKSAVGRDMQRAGFGEPDVAVNAGPFVKPALELRGIHPHRHRVWAAAIGQVGDVVAETAVTAFVMAEKVAVEKNAAIAINAVELQHQPAAAVFSGKLKSAAIPGHAVGMVAGAERLEAVIGIGVGIERQFGQPVMRQVDGAPIGVGERAPGRPRVDAALSRRSLRPQSSPR